MFEYGFSNTKSGIRLRLMSADKTGSLYIQKLGRLIDDVNMFGLLKRPVFDVVTLSRNSCAILPKGL